MKLFQGFKAFISKGSIIDLAIGVIMGGAFGKIVNSVINDLLFPLIAALLGETDFSNLVWNIKIGTDPLTLEPIYSSVRYGNFIQVVFEFFIIALFIYIVIVQLVKGQYRKEQLEKEQPKTVVAQVPEDIQLLREIRDTLKEQSKQ